MDPLKGVDDVDWSALRHAYGSADDVPEALRSFLVGGDPADEASVFVSNSLFHQGTIYSATAAAVPFLAALIASKGVARRGGLTSGLTILAVAATNPRIDEAVRVAAVRALERSARVLVRAAITYRGSRLEPMLGAVLATIPKASRRALSTAKGRVGEPVLAAIERGETLATLSPDERVKALFEWIEGEGKDILDEEVELDPPGDPPEPTPKEEATRQAAVEAYLAEARAKAALMKTQRESALENLRAGMLPVPPPLEPYDAAYRSTYDRILQSALGLEAPSGFVAALLQSETLEKPDLERVLGPSTHEASGARRRHNLAVA